MAQAVVPALQVRGPEFKPQYHQNGKKLTENFQKVINNSTKNTKKPL
jgi:hypothetical protein